MEASCAPPSRTSIFSLAHSQHGDAEEQWDVSAATAARGAMPMIRVLLSRKFWPLTMAAVSGAGTAGPMTHRSSASSTPSTAVARLGCFITNLSRPAAALTRSSGKLAG